MEWDDYASGWDQREEVRAYADAAFESLRRQCDELGFPLAGARVCDFGCGTGLLSEKLAASEALVSSYPHLQLPFDMVVCSSVCAFLDDYPGAVTLLTRLLRPGGLFVQWDWELDPNEAEPFGLERSAIRNALEAAGLDVLSLDTGFRLTVGEDTMAPLMGVGRKRTNS